MVQYFVVIVVAFTLKTIPISAQYLRDVFSYETVE